MWLNVPTIAALFFLIDVTHGLPQNHNELERIFQLRSKSDWEDAWHMERFSRCREALHRHLYWACENDIYRVIRRSPTNTLTPYDDENYYKFPWIAERKALSFLRSRRGRNGIYGSSITSECCTQIGCTWEEYAEYCPTNKRRWKLNKNTTLRD